MAKEKVVILGGGGGGAILANLLPQDRFEVTVVDKSEYHVFLPGFLWVAFKGQPKEKFRRPLKSLLKPGVNFVHDEVVGVDLNERTVHLKGGGKLGYDYVVFATGAPLDFDAIPGHRELVERFGDFYSTLENAEKLHRTLASMREGRFVIAIADPIYKCPPGPHKGTFLSYELFKKRGVADKVKVVLAVPYPHVYSSKTIADVIEPELEARGIETHTFFTVDSIDLEKHKIYSLEGEELDFTAAAVIAPHTGPQYKVEPGNVKDDSGYIRIDKYTSQVVGFDDAYAIGDCTNAPSAKSGVTAHLQAETVAKRLQGFDARYTGRTNCPLITDGKGLFVISDYEHPAIPVRLSGLKRFLEELFVATYWSAIKYPELWDPIFEAYFEASAPEVFLRYGGW